MKRFIPYLLLAILFVSCKDEFTICELSTGVRMQCGFYHNTAGVEAETAVPFLTVTKLSSPTPDYAQASLSKFSLALNPITDSVEYIISIQMGAVPDTVTFVYTTTQINLSATCGDIYINDLTRVRTTTHTLDSAKIISSPINTTSGENIKIYF